MAMNHRDHEKRNRRKFVKRDTRGLRRGGPGRPKGLPNHATREARELSRLIVQDPNYFKHLKKRMIAGDAPPAVECMCWYYAFGKPRERVELAADKSLAQLINEAAGYSDDEGPSVEEA